jgi:hypothetical protein
MYKIHDRLWSKALSPPKSAMPEELLPPEMYTILGVFAPENNLFQVEIDERARVLDLMMEIKKQNSATLAGVDANNLQIYHFNIEPDESDEQKQLTQASEISKDLGFLKRCSISFRSLEVSR